MILLDGVYINKGGGGVLLEELIEKIFQLQIENKFYFLFDNRFNSEKIGKTVRSNCSFISGNEFDRKKIYLQLYSKIDSIFCFGNVPPPIAINKKKVYIYFHNALLLDSYHSGYNFLEHTKFLIKRVYIKIRDFNNYTWIVQTKSMKNRLSKTMGISEYRIIIFPFYKENINSNPYLNLNKFSKKFLFVADGDKQKNHVNLLRAWKLISYNLDSELELNLTISDRFPDLMRQIKELKNCGCNIINHGFISENQILELYHNCKYLIYPSISESFGLPLIEAANAGCEIIASDLQYVYDVVIPLRTFNPLDATSIYESVKFTYENPTLRETKNLTTNQINNLIKYIIN